MSTEPVREAAFFTTIRSWELVRSEAKVLGGVLGGVGNRIGMAPAPTRILFVLAAIFTGGIALLAYAAAWALLPDHEGTIVAQDFGRGRPNVGALVVIGILTVLGFITLGQFGLGSSWRSGSFHVFRDDGVFGTGLLGTNLWHLFWVILAVVVPLAILGGIAALIVWAVRSSRTSTPEALGYARLPDGSMPDAAAGQAETAADVPPTQATAVPDATTASDTLLAAPPQPPAPPLYMAPAPPKPPRKPRVPGPGKVGYLLTLALIPISIAITVYLWSTDQLAVFPVVVGGVIFTAGLGLVLVINALRGRKAGFLGFLSVVALIPTVVAIGAAPELREHYAAGDWTLVWDRQFDPVPYESEVPVPQPDPVDIASAFSDYSFVAITAECYQVDDYMSPEGAALVSLSAVTADQSITVTSPDTRVLIPRGTSVTIINDTSVSMGTSVSVAWIDRDVNCSSYGSSATVAELANPDEPVLTIRVNDVQGYGFVNLWIEEN